MSAICQNFVQNAWKKELCSNCFKSKDEHNLTAKLKPLVIGTTKAVEGIIKGDKTKPKRSVCFTSELSRVIGYGGEDWTSDNENGSDCEDGNDNQEEDFEIEEEEEEEARELHRLTKANTDFNSTSLADCNEVKKSFTQLLLGKPQVDSEGRKQTLLVSVTPFGQENNVTKKVAKTISHIPIARTNKESIPETKTSNVILTSYTKNDTNVEEKSLLDEITETLENGKNPIQIITRKKTEKEIVLSVAKPDNKENELDVKNDEKNGENNKTNRFNGLERKNGLSRAPVIIKRDHEKPVYQTSTAKIELLNTKNLKFHVNKDALNFRINKADDKPNKTDEQISTDNKKEEIKPAEESDKTTDTSSNESDSLDSSIDSTTKILGLPPQVPKYTTMLYTQSREQAGEPDGRADPDSPSEPPALPLSPPPMEIQASFLHGTPQPYEKPKVPAKPVSTAFLRKPLAPTIQVEAQNPTLTTFTPETRNGDVEKMKLTKQDSNDSTRIANKRRAPQPPDETPTVLIRNSPATFDLPEKRERSSSCSPKLREAEEDLKDPNYATIPEPVPRKLLSMSTDSLADDKRKDKAKNRFSLKKFLRMGANKDGQKFHLENGKSENGESAHPQPKPRLIIVHPLDLNGAKVEVVSKPMVQENTDYSVPNNICTAECTEKTCNSPKINKPPPPPRNLEDQARSKPMLPTPPKSAEILYKQKQQPPRNNNKKVDSVYANIGEVRTALKPHKPQRTASMREREALQEKQKKAVESYEQISVTDGNGEKDCNENVYDYIHNGRSSSPEYDSGIDKNSPTTKAPRTNGLLKQKSESQVDVSGECFKYSHIPRSLSLTYCGSETESEIYSPYSFYGSESEVTEDDHDWTTLNGRTHKLRSRKGRSIVHKNLEDNYGAVIVANHEALAQVLENIQQNTSIQPALRGLKTSSNLRWSDFNVKTTIQPVIVGTRAFHQAMWGTQHVTLVICAGSIPTSSLSLGMFSLMPITEFSDLIPSKFVPNQENLEDKHIQATIGVLPWLQVNTIHSYGEVLKGKSQAHEDVWKDGSFILLQLVNALKVLQAQGIEELPLSLTSFVLCREVDKDCYYRLSVLQGLGEATYKTETGKYGTLCMCASKALAQVLPSAKTTQLVQSLLNNERAVSLTQVKSILEFSLWGPSDVALGSTIRERELALQRWLDLQRATVLHGLVCTRVQLTVYEECHLLFLVRSNARMMCDASLLLESNSKQQIVTNGLK